MASAAPSTALRNVSRLTLALSRAVIRVPSLMPGIWNVASWSKNPSLPVSWSSRASKYDSAPFDVSDASSNALTWRRAADAWLATAPR